MKSRAIILKITKRLLEERVCRKEAGTDEIGESGLLGLCAPSSLSNLVTLGLLFGSHETTTVTITMSLYFLQDCPKGYRDQLRVSLMCISS